MQTVVHAGRKCAPFLLLAVFSGCIHFEDDHGHDNEIISRVELTFVSDEYGDQVFVFDDPDGDGGMSGVADRIELAANTTYSLRIRFQNGLVDPPEDLTPEIEAEAEEHWVFVIGDITGYAYDDAESTYGMNAVGENLPVGLRSVITTNDSGTGELRVMLRHLPELNGEPQKSGDLPEQLAAGEDLPGGVDVDVTFELTVL